MSIPFGKAHEQWSALKQKESKQGTKNVDSLFKLDLGPTLDKFDAACKASNRPKAKEQAAKLHGILPKYVTASSKLKLASEFKAKLTEIEQYVWDNLDACLPATAPSTFKYMKQGNDGLCAFYALYHFTNGGLTKEQFIQTASRYYKEKLGMPDTGARELALDGNDPAVLLAFGRH
ncbi:MAG: hypothetical protein JO022_17860, partial [Acidobacteriaceae bacterium]|nr:hypothetical protein [Acidobacteriaceae bacterium]